MSGKKILLISVGHPDLVLGGTPVVCQELFDELRTRFIDSTMLAAVTEESGKTHHPRAGITGYDNRDGVYLLHQNNFDYWLNGNKDVFVVNAFIEFLRGLAPDVVHFHHFQSIGLDLITTVREILPACRIILTFHEFAAICAADGHMVRRNDRSLCEEENSTACHRCFPDREASEFRKKKIWTQYHLSHVDHFTCPSRFMIEFYVRWGIQRNKISHVTNGQRSKFIRPMIVQAAKPPWNRFGFFGLLHDDKGVTVLLRAANLLRRSGFTQFKININGGGMQYASPGVRQEIAAFQETERLFAEPIVTFNGEYHRDQIQSRMREIDWTIMPSVWREIFGLVISEAWMFRKPVICSNIGGMAERVTDDVNGLHFKMGDPTSLATTIHRACTEDGLWQRLQAAVPQAPSHAEMTDGFLALY